MQSLARSFSSSASGSANRLLVLVRHGESVWNKENRFTGWVDVDLSEKGVAEAHEGGRLLKQEGLQFDVGFTSVLKRAIKTSQCVLDDIDQTWLPVTRTWRLNERMYGALQGLDKAETVAKHGMDQVMQWRRSYSLPPPPLTPDHQYYPGRDPRYAGLERVPLTECLKDTVERFLPFWHSDIAPALQANKRVLVVAHGNSIRALVKYLDDISENDIVELNIPTGVPLVYNLDANLRPIPQPGAVAPLKGRYLGDPEEVLAKIRGVAGQLGTKKTTPPASPRTASNATDAQAAAQAEILASSKAFQDHFNKSNLTGISDLYEEDAVILPPSADGREPPVVISGGVRVFQGFYKAFIDAGTQPLTLTPTSVTFDAPDLATEIGHYSHKLGRGNYMVNWKRTGNKWRMLRDMINN
eukprot:gnl/Hemi2/11798_TR4049_c0_g1_i1.p1 gnl/Hemi2/11798_TR4049_c0_g1~~gnl/Hemi2/11798_TR4049_c0_g1_i1.p1  ORF type:complete len:431 (+),score=89.53 gnl/Hemi2/11798_TR4049_c0_g1_i1:59-1294(+)